MKGVLSSCAFFCLGVLQAQVNYPRPVADLISPKEIPSGQAFLFTVTLREPLATACPEVWVRRTIGPAYPKQAGLVSASGKIIQFRAMLNPGEEGVYGVFACITGVPPDSLAADATFRVVSPLELREKEITSELERKVAEAVRVATSANRRVQTLESEVTSLKQQRELDAAVVEEAKAMANSIKQELAGKASVADLRSLVDETRAMTKSLDDRVRAMSDSQQRLAELSERLRRMEEAGNFTRQELTSLKRGAAMALDKVGKMGEKKVGGVLGIGRRPLLPESERKEVVSESRRLKDPVRPVPSTITSELIIR